MIHIILILFIILLLFIINKKVENFKEYDNKYENYRLGDIVSGLLRRKKNNDYYNNFSKNYPNTIASKYINQTSKLPEKKKDFNFKVLTNICKSYKKKVKNDNIVVHLRIGDSLINKINNKYIFLSKGKIFNFDGFLQPNDFQKLIDLKLKNHKSNKVFLVYGFHNSNFNKKISDDYVQDVKKIFIKNGYVIKKHINGNPDEDFLFMINSKIFISSGGRFSNIIKNVINYNNSGFVYSKENIRSAIND